MKIKEICKILGLMTVFGVIVLFGVINYWDVIVGQTAVVSPDKTVFHDNILYVNCSNPINGSIKVYVYDNKELVNGIYYNFTDFFEPGFLWRNPIGTMEILKFNNGKGQILIDSNYFVLDAYGGLDQNVGSYSDNSSYYNTVVTISYNGKILSNTKAYSDQFDIENGLNIIRKDGHIYGDDQMVYNGQIVRGINSSK